MSIEDANAVETTTVDKTGNHVKGERLKTINSAVHTSAKKVSDIKVDLGVSLSAENTRYQQQQEEITWSPNSKLHSNLIKFTVIGLQFEVGLAVRKG